MPAARGPRPTRIRATQRMASWRPDWQRMMAQAPELRLDGGGPAAAREGYVYLVADSHLGDHRAPPEGFLAMLERLPQARLLVLMGDLCKVWLALPKFWDRQARTLLAGLQALRAKGVPIWFVVGNREFFVPREAAAAQALGLPFDAIVPDAAVLRWGERRYGLSHGDLVNRRDAQYLKWRRLARSGAFAAAFRAIPGPLARRIARGLERRMASTNQEIKIRYPADELEAFAAAVLEGLDGFFIGHFHRDETIRPPGRSAALRIVPDWFSRKQVLRLHPDGRQELLVFPPSGSQVS
jgi:UDP-2,3-diacylglucosamine hydrolase